MAASITFNGEKIIQEIDILQQRQIPFIAALTISGRKKGDESLASQTKKDLVEHMRNVFFVSPLKRDTEWLFDTPKARKNSLKTVISHKEDADKGNSPAKYLLPQIIGGPVVQTRFQTELKKKGYLKNQGYFLPDQEVPGTRHTKSGRLAPSEYTKAMWSIGAMEYLRGRISRKGVNVHDKNDTFSKLTKGSYFHVPENVARNNLGGKTQERYAQFVRGLAYKKGKHWKSLPSPGIYKLNAKGQGMTQVFRQLDRVPVITDPNYKFKETATASVQKNAQRIFDLKVKEVLGT